MKKSIITLVTLLAVSFASASFAQGKLTGMKSKMEEKLAKLGQPSTAGDQAQILEDSTSTVLESKTYTKDKYNISGIYYSQKPLMYNARNGGEKNQTFKKFLLTFNDKMNTIEFTNRLSTGMDYSDHQYHTFRYGNNDARDLRIAAFNKGVFSNMTGNYGSEFYYYYDKNTYRTYDATNGIAKYTVSSGHLTQLEPGVFAMHSLILLENSIESCGGPKFYEPTYDEQSFNLIYQAGKDISKWTPDAIKARIFELRIRDCEIYNGVYLSQNDLPKTLTTIKDAPTKAELMAAVKARAAEYNYTQTIKDVRLMEEWNGKYELLGLTALRTLTARTMEVVVIMTNETGSCTFETMKLIQFNNYQTGSLEENYGNAKIKVIANGPNTLIECAKVK